MSQKSNENQLKNYAAREQANDNAVKDDLKAREASDKKADGAVKMIMFIELNDKFLKFLFLKF